jgi:hypothetical protein
MTPSFSADTSWDTKAKTALVQCQLAHWQTPQPTCSTHISLGMRRAGTITSEHDASMKQVGSCGLVLMFVV